MGLRMDDLHTPTVPSGPTTRLQGNDAGISRLSLIDLIDRKDRLEEELKALGSVLDSHGVNMNTSLTTFDGYPRDDIDVAQIRTTRSRIIHLKNDYKEIMNRIEKALHQHHASLHGSEDSKEEPPSSLRQNASSASTQTPSRTTSDPPFAKVNSVATSSPAQEAGLKVGDKIRNFGTVHWRNHENLRKVAEVVQRSERRTILVKIVRDDETRGSSQDLELPLIPRSGWGGRGTLGCHLLPI
ncbi:hypothetical protein GJ744_004320 [Endocarpon pusillum]|uniref:Probable 26S proteasome regulatory subunit p27 n=1 Tax=Endocarpon pusillum TaxID=364733 RepID=A0A8H7E1K9_9EURO|nr:hypothetical protein GJ744_004320 [Endocarpon pusillum]